MAPAVRQAEKNGCSKRRWTGRSSPALSFTSTACPTTISPSCTKLSKLDPSAFPPLHPQGLRIPGVACAAGTSARLDHHAPRKRLSGHRRGGRLARAVLFGLGRRLSVMMPEGEPDPSFNPSEAIERGHAGTEGREVVREQGGGTLRLAKRLEPDEEGEDNAPVLGGREAVVRDLHHHVRRCRRPPVAIGVLCSISNRHG